MRIQCGRVPKSKYSVSDESVNSNGRERVLLPNLEGDVFKNRSALRTWGLMLKFFLFGWNAFLKYQYLGVELPQVKS